MRWINIILILATFLTYLAPLVSPATFWPFSIIGLSYPWLLLFNMLFALYWAIRRETYALFSLGCILLGWSHLTSFIGMSPYRNPQKTTLNILTFNSHGLQYRGDYGFKVSVEDFVAVLEKEPVQVVCIQEFPKWRPFLDKYVAEIQKKTKLKYYFHEDGTSLAFFSAYPILNKSTHLFKNKANGFQVMDIQVQDQKVRIYNVHLQSNGVSGMANRVAEEGNLQTKETWLDIRGMLGRFKQSAQKRAHQAAQIEAHIKSSKYPVFVCGDFNDTPQSYTYRTLKKGKQDTFRSGGFGLGVTFAGKIPGLRIDYILAPTQARVLDCKVLRSVDISDHYPVYSQIALPF